MKLRLTFIALSLIALMAPMAISAESVSDLPVKEINGKKYHYYQVEPKETVYSICRRLGISREELIRNNPSAEDMLRAGQTLLFAIEPTATAVTTHKVEKGETPYGISKKYSITIDEFYALNPEARDGLKAGETVKVGHTASTSKSKQASTITPVQKTVEQPKSANSTVTSTSTKTYTIAPHETLYQIASRNNTTLSELLAANPGLNVDHYEAGQEIVIPSKTVTAAGNPEPAAVSQPQTVTPVTTPVDATPTFATKSADTIAIAIALPFDAANEQRDQRAKRAQEFYRGFVVAIDTMSRYGKPIKLLTYDTKSSADAVNSILSDPNLAKANVIIAPDDATQMSRFAKFAADNKIYLLNLFVVKDEQYRRNPYIMHSNITHDMMYDKAINYFTSTFPDVTPVILKRVNGKEDKKEFVAELKKNLTAKGVKYHEIEYNDKLSAATLEGLNENGNYAFIPISSTMEEMHKFIDAICKFKESHTGGTVALWGYAEWLTARGENEQKLHDANTFLFSRFYSVEKDNDEERLQNSFEHWYGTRIEDKVPKQGTYGFDTGMYLIRALNANDGDFSHNTPQYDGIQNAFHFIPVDGGGWVNDEMFIINFAPAGMTYKFGI